MSLAGQSLPAGSLELLEIQLPAMLDMRSIVSCVVNLTPLREMPPQANEGPSKLIFGDACVDTASEHP